MGKSLLLLSKAQLKAFIGIGFLIAIHWLTFYGSVKLANASVTLICMATTSLFTAIIEPLLLKQRFQRLDLLLGALIIPSMALVVNGIDEAYYLGVVVGLISAFMASLFSVFNKKYVGQVNVLSMTFVEILGVFISLSLLLPFLWSQGTLVFLPPTTMDWIYLGVLAILCTTVAWVVSLIALRKLTVFEANLVVNLEPVYGIVLAALILKEYQQVNFSFYIGASLITLIVLLYPKIKRKYA